jgi:hypothetical protein
MFVGFPQLRDQSCDFRFVRMAAQKIFNVKQQKGRAS